MKKILENLKGWKTTLIGILFLKGAAIYLFQYDAPNILIFWGFIVIALGLLFAPDNFVKALSNLMQRKSDKL